MEKTRLVCPCGQLVVGRDGDELVLTSLQHLDDVHPDLAGRYTREYILFMAT